MNKESKEREINKCKDLLKKDLRGFERLNIMNYLKSLEGENENIPLD